MKVFVYHTPELVPLSATPDCAIAIDVLRATTTIAAALAADAEAVQVFSSLEDLMHESEQWPAERRLRAGERGGAKVSGYDLGNSPLDCTSDRVKSRRLFMSTTNGTRCLERIQGASVVLAAALINRQAIVNYLCRQLPQTVWLVGSGWEGSFALEDTICAGAIIHSLLNPLSTSLKELAGNDEAINASALYSQWQDQLLDGLHHASHGQRLLRLDCHDDLKYCAQIDSVDILPIQKEPGVLVRY